MLLGCLDDEVRDGNKCAYGSYANGDGFAGENA